MVAILLCGGVASYLALLYQATLLSSQPELYQGFNPFVLAISLSLGAVASELGVRQVRKQSRPVIVGLKAGLVQAIAVLCFKAIETPAIADLDLRGWLLDPGLALVGGLISGGIVTSLLPQIEVAFGVLTERRLLELSDPIYKLLRVLRERAPGTFQHTLGVQQLAHDATAAIGGNVLLADAGAGLDLEETVTNVLRNAVSFKNLYKIEFWLYEKVMPRNEEISKHRIQEK